MNRGSLLELFPGETTPRLYDRAAEVLRTRRYSRSAEGLRNDEGDMLIRIRRRGNKSQKTQVVEPEGIVAAACADSTACYEGLKPALRILRGSS